MLIENKIMLNNIINEYKTNTIISLFEYIPKKVGVLDWYVKCGRPANNSKLTDPVIFVSLVRALIFFIR